MKRVFLDTNILMDAIEFRQHGAEANLLLDMSRANIIQTCVAVMSFSTLSYLLRRRTKEDIHQIFENLADALRFCQWTTSNSLKVWHLVQYKISKT